MKPQQVFDVAIRVFGLLVTFVAGFFILCGLSLLPTYGNHWSPAWPNILFGVVGLASGLFLMFGIMKRFVLFNAIVLVFFCGLWFGGFYMSEKWMRIIDLGAPWSWLVATFIVSYSASLWAMREKSKFMLKSVVGPLLTAPALFFWIDICNVWFDPFY
jgi:hypothetical protein